MAKSPKGQTFSKIVDKWTKQTPQRMLAVYRTSAQFVGDDVIRRTPVDTGFLRNSFTASLNGPITRRKAKRGSFSSDPYTLVISRATLQTPINFNFLAEYAVHVEFGTKYMQGYGMMRLAAQAWPAHVRRAIAMAKSRVGGK